MEKRNYGDLMRVGRSNPFFRVACLLVCALLANSCSISYTFNGATIDYNLVKNISIKEFPNHATLVYPTLSQTFTEALRNRYIQQTKLTMVSGNADMELEGEITDYSTMELAVKEDARASMTRLTIVVKIRFINNKKPEDDLEQTFSNFRDYDNSRSLDSVQDELIREIVNDLTDEIFNATLGKW